MEPLNIIVLCGGLSTERNISFLTGSRVCAALRSRGHRAVLTDLYLGFEELGGEQYKKAVKGGKLDTDMLFSDLPPIPSFSFDGQAPDLEAVRRSRKWKNPSIFGNHVLEACRDADIVFVALHGKNGEDGRVQAAFDMMGIPYTGSGYLGAAMAMDKMITKMIVSSRGVRTPAFRRWDFMPSAGAAGDPEILRKEQDRFVHSVCRQTAVPCVVKTPDGGSSVGVYIVHKKEELAPAVRSCLEYGNAFMVEQYIQGKELTCGVLCGKALPSVEIVPKVRFYDYSNKYVAGATEEICPGRVSEEIEKEIGRIALSVHEIMELRTYSRSDVILDEEGNVWFIEVNTLPGMTATSLVPQEAAKIGIGYEDLCEMIIQDALSGKRE